MSKHIWITGDPVLRQRAAEVPLDKIKSNEVANVIKQMKNVLRSFNLVGLAAPQIGVASRIIVMEASEQLREKYPTAMYKARGCEVLPMTVSDWSIWFVSIFADSKFNFCIFLNCFAYYF